MILASRIASSGTKLRITIWDSPEYILQSQRIFSPFKNEILNNLSSCFDKSVAVSVMGKNMRQWLEYNFKKEAIELLPPLVVKQGVKKDINGEKFIRIFFAGSLYAKKEWNSLIRALRSINWMISDKKVVIYFAGTFPIFGALKDKNVKLLGYLSEEKVIDICTKCHIGYVPYWTSPDMKLVSETSFPSKLFLYAKCGVPALFHGPVMAEANNLFATYKIGASTSSMRSEDIIKAVNSLCDANNRREFQSGMENLERGFLSPRNVKKNLAKFFSD